jgi:hypothetical protein
MLCTQLETGSQSSSRRGPVAVFPYRCSGTMVRGRTVGDAPSRRMASQPRSPGGILACTPRVGCPLNGARVGAILSGEVDRETVP